MTLDDVGNVCKLDFPTYKTENHPLIYEKFCPRVDRVFTNTAPNAALLDYTSTTILCSANYSLLYGGYILEKYDIRDVIKS